MTRESFSIGRRGMTRDHCSSIVHTFHFQINFKHAYLWAATCRRRSSSNPRIADCPTVSPQRPTGNGCPKAVAPETYSVTCHNHYM